MEDAKHAVEAFIARNGSHDTTVHEKVSRAITHDTVTKTEHEVGSLSNLTITLNS